MKTNTLLKLCLSIVIGLTSSCDLDASYTIGTFAGTNASSGFSGDEAIATSAKLSSPIGICRDSYGNIYIADTGNHRIQMVFNAFPTGVSTLFGSSSYTSGYIYTIAGSAIGTQTINTGTSPAPGSNLGDGGLATSATLFSPNGICVDGSGNLYIADTSNGVIRMVYNSDTVFNVGSPTYTPGYIYTIAGGRTLTGNAGKTSSSYSGDGSLATSAKLRTPVGVCLDNYGNNYIADTGNNVIRTITNHDSFGYIYTIFGSNPNTPPAVLAAPSGYAGDGGLAASSSVRFSAPRGICFDSLGNLYIADSTNTVIRMVCNTAGTYFGSSRTQDYIYTIVGTGPSASDRYSVLNTPSGVCVDSSGNLYIASTGNHGIRMDNTSGTISLIAGSTTGTSGHTGDGGAAIITTTTTPGSGIFSSPKGVCVDSSNPPNVYVADTNNHCIRKFLAPLVLTPSSLTAISSTLSIASNYAVVFNGGGVATISSNNGATLLGGIVLSGRGTTVEFNHLTGSIADSLGAGASGNVLTMGTGTSIEVGIALTAAPSIMPVPISYSGDITINTADDTRATHSLETLAITCTASGANVITVKGGGTYTPAGVYTTGGTDVLAIVDSGTTLNLTNASYVPAEVKLGTGTTLSLGCNLTSTTIVVD